MIKVLFPPGCYGTYMTRCIYNYTNLRVEDFKDFSFSADGSSHQHRQHAIAKTVINQGHLGYIKINENDRIVKILPLTGHRLDYYNNQFFKQQQGQLIRYITTQLSPQSIKNKLEMFWNYSGNLDDQTPRWILREWCSLWINDVLTSSYDATGYDTLESEVQLSTQDIFENFLNIFNEVVSRLNLDITVPVETITEKHKQFLSLQKYHNSQNKCDQYVNDILLGNEKQMLLLSIFDEAYIQHSLRAHGLEIRCDGLNVFPTTTQDLKSLTYENSNDCH